MPVTLPTGWNALGEPLGSPVCPSSPLLWGHVVLWDCPTAESHDPGLVFLFPHP